MATKATDCDFMVREAYSPDKFEKFMQTPDAFEQILKFTPHNEIAVYDEVDVEKRPELRQDGKVAVVTGAGRGIGRAIAIMLAKAGARAVGICARTTIELEETRKEINKLNSSTEVYLQQVDVTSEEAVKSFFETTTSKFGTIDVAVANAGAQSIWGLMVDNDADTWWNDFTVNVKGTFLFTKYYARSLGSKQGTLINISSSAAITTAPQQSAYATSKLAGMRIIENVRLEAPNIRAFNVHPGVVKTKMLEENTARAGVQLSWRGTDPELTGAVSLWLTTDKAEFLRGRFVSVNWRVDELVQQEKSIVENHLLKSGFNAALGSQVGTG